MAQQRGPGPCSGGGHSPFSGGPRAHQGGPTIRGELGGTPTAAREHLQPHVHLSRLPRQACSDARQNHHTSHHSNDDTPSTRALTARPWAIFTALPGGHCPDPLSQMGKQRPREAQQPTRDHTASEGWEVGTRAFALCRPTLHALLPQCGPKRASQNPHHHHHHLLATGCGAVCRASSRQEQLDARKEPGYRPPLEEGGPCRQLGSRPSTGQAGGPGASLPGLCRRQHRKAICLSTCLSATGTDRALEPPFLGFQYAGHNTKAFMLINRFNSYTRPTYTLP